MNSAQLANLLLEMPQIAKTGKAVTADGKNLKDVPLDSVVGNIVVFRQPTESLFPAGFTLVYFMDSDESAKAMKAGELPYKLVPERSQLNAFNSAPITDVWKKANDKGQGSILGMLQGTSNDDEIYIDKMTVRPGFKRHSMTTKMVDTLKRRFPRAAVNFSGPTKEGSKFIKSYTGKDWKPAHGERAEFSESIRSLIEKGAHAARLKAALNDVDPEPTESEIEAGNYAKGHVHLHGMDITIENAKGSLRSGTDKSGKEWSVTMPASYGYIKGTKGKDKDHLDVYIGPDPASELVVVVNQQTQGGRFDEHKIMLGFSNEKKATETYDKAFSGSLGPKLRKSVHAVTMAAFKKWLKSGKHKEPFKPLHESAQSLPVKRITKVWHVGSLNKSDAGSVSYEGGLGLSVSRTPEAWIRIARLGGKPTHMLTCSDGRFVDMAKVDRARYAHGRSSDTWGLSAWEKGVASAALQQGFDGLWWDAPTTATWSERGVIFDEALSRWTVDGEPLREHVMASAEPKTSESLQAEIIFAGIILRQVFDHIGYDRFVKNREIVIEHALKQSADRFHVADRHSLAVIRSKLEVDFAKLAKLSESQSHFHVPENWDPVEALSTSDYKVHAGANDWEATWTAAAVYCGTKDRGFRVWIELDIPGAGDDPTPEGFDKDAGEKAVKEWLKKAKAERKAGSKDDYTPSWTADHFMAAAKKMGKVVKRHGKDTTSWKADKVVEHLLEDEGDLPLDGLDLDSAIHDESRRVATGEIDEDVYAEAEQKFMFATRNTTDSGEADNIAADVIFDVAKAHRIENGSDAFDHLVSFVNGLACRHFPEPDPEDEDDVDF